MTDQATQQTSQSSQGAGDQSQSQGGGQTGTTQGSTATQTTSTQTGQSGSQQQQTQAAARPDWLPTNFYDEKSGPKWDDFGKHFSEVMTRDAAAQSRLLSLPQKPEDVKLELPKDFKLPTGMEFKLDATQPEFAKFQQLAVKRGLDADTVSEVLGLYAETIVGSESQLSAAKQAEITKLGANGPARVGALETFFTGLVGADKAKSINGMMVTAGIVEALESVVAKFASQGAASFSQQHRVPPEQQGKATQEQYDKMTDAEKLDYARRFPQPQAA